MQHYFFETNEWEESVIRERFPDAVFIRDSLVMESTMDLGPIEVLSVFVNSRVTREVLDRMPNLKFVATRSTGFDHVDVAACKERNIPVSNVPEYGSRTVAEFTFGLLLTLSRRLFSGIRQSKECIFDTSVLQGVDLYGKTLGIIGLGRIGIEVLKIAKGFGMEVIVYTEHQHAELAEQYGFPYVSLEDLQARADVVTLHLPLTPETKHIINKENILRFKKGSYLINTARGPLIETEALLLALEQDIFAGVGLDVLEEEREIADELELLTRADQHGIDFKTLCSDHVLMHHPKVIVTPHNAFNTKEALERILHTTLDNVSAYEGGSPKNTV